MLVLKALRLGPMHGWGISERIQSASRDLLRLKEGSLYPALYRLEKQGFVRSEWRTTETNRMARYYTITVSGRAQLKAEREKWERITRAVNLVLRTAED